MRIALDPQDRQFLQELHRLGAATVAELGERLGVTATAVRQRLVRLEGHALVSRQTVREGRGRPHHVYEVTPAALHDLGDNYSELAMILWREIGRIEDAEIRQGVVSRIREALISRYGHSSEGLSVLERFVRLKDSLHEHGFDVELGQQSGLPILRENHCPYLELATQDPAICELEHAVFEEALGMRIERTNCCLDGHHCCEFTPVAEIA